MKLKIQDFAHKILFSIIWYLDTVPLFHNLKWLKTLKMSRYGVSKNLHNGEYRTCIKKNLVEEIENVDPLR